MLEDFINELALMIIDRKTHAITRVAVNGVDGSGKSNMADALAANLLERGEHVIRGQLTISTMNGQCATPEGDILLKDFIEIHSILMH